MRLNEAASLEALAKLLNCAFEGDAKLLAHGINEIHMVNQGDIAFVDHPKYYDKTLQSDASVVIINKEVDCPEGKGLLIHPEPFSAFNQLITHFAPPKHSHDRIDTSASIAASAYVHPTASVGSNTSIGEHCVIHANVSIGSNCVIGDRVEIHANTTIGSDAFYYKTRPETFEKLLSCGRVVIENDVEIGAGCTIDRGSTGDTYIGAHSKFDNQVHIGHDVRIGKRCLFAAQVGIAGCVTIEDNVTMWGQVGCIANVTIGKGAVIMAQSGIGKSLEGGKTYFGSPAGEARNKLKELAYLSLASKSSK